MLRVGSCSWTDPTLLKEGHWYPAGISSPEQRLRYYAQQFPVVEVDATYYRLPDEATAFSWEQRTPGGFVFDVKLYALLSTHPTPPKSLPKDLREELPAALLTKRNLYLRDVPAEIQAELWRRFRQALQPLHTSGKLGAVMLQFPHWFFPSHESREYIRAARQQLAGLRCAVEFRHGSWVNDKNRERTFEFLHEQGLSYVCVDEPQEFKDSVPPLLAVTDPELAVFRFHGHNAEAWKARGLTAAERFRYLYSQQELEGWAPKIVEVSTKARETHALMNNCYRDYAMRNATQLTEILVRLG